MRIEVNGEGGQGGGGRIEGSGKKKQRNTSWISRETKVEIRMKRKGYEKEEYRKEEEWSRRGNKTEK